MAQIAQQDDLLLVDEGKLSGLHQPTKDKLKQCVEDKTILSVVVKTKEADNMINVSKVLGYQKDVTNPKKPTYKIVFVNTNTGALYTLSLDAL